MTDKYNSVQIEVDGKQRSFAIDDPDLPKWVREESFSSNNYPYEKKLDWDEYEEQLEALQIELVKLQQWQQKTGKRIIILFEGRDAAGKGGSIKALTQYLNPRHARVVALAKPTEKERGEWYFQRYVHHFPTEGEMVIFDRSWYNRAGVEPVMGFCSEVQHQQFLSEATSFERMIVTEDIHFFKIWLDAGQEMQIKRFHDRRHNPLKIWKLSPMDLNALHKWGEYTAARDEMLTKTDSVHAPWIAVLSNDKRRARLNLIRHILNALDYEGKKENNIGKIDKKILGRGLGFLNATQSEV